MFYGGSSMKSDKKLLFGFIIHFPPNHILKSEMKKSFRSFLAFSFFLPRQLSNNVHKFKTIMML